MKWSAIAFLSLLVFISLVYGLGSALHAFYYTAMILFSKLTFAAMFGIFAIIIVGLIVAYLNKRD